MTNMIKNTGFFTVFQKHIVSYLAFYCQTGQIITKTISCSTSDGDIKIEKVSVTSLS
jgi:hypothetical protein